MFIQPVTADEMEPFDSDLVTIILTTLDSERYVARSIESCLRQTHTTLELIVVDGGSSDRTLAVVAEFADPRIRVIHQRENSGKLPGALNLGMAAARGAFITWTQDDCWYETNAIETMVRYLQYHPQVALVYADYWDVNTEGQPIRYQRVNDPSAILDDDVVRQCFMFRREVSDTIGPQEPIYFPVHEVPWRVRIAQQFCIEPLHIALMHYMVHDDSLTGRIGGYELQRLMNRALWTDGHFDRDSYRCRSAKIDLDEAYEQYIRKGEFLRFWILVLSAISRYNGHLANRGLWQLAIMSLTPWRTRYRKRLLSEWETNDAVVQHQYMSSVPASDAAN